MRKVIVVLSVIALMAGCSKKKTKIDIVETQIVAPAPRSEPVKTVAPEPVVFKEAPTDPDNAQFRLDSYVLSPESFDLLADIGRRMRNDAELNLYIYGACCPRGTYGYNLALGQHRAYACQKYLADYGIDPTRIVCVSWGEDSSRLLTRNVEEYRLNRRSEFDYKLVRDK